MTRLHYSLTKEFITAFIEFPILLVILILAVPLRLKCSYLRADRENQGRQLLLLGNGPSMRNSLDRISASRAKYVLMMVNNAPLSDQFFILQPEYLCIIDSMYWLEPSLLHPLISTNISRFFSQLNRVTWHLDVYVPTKAKKIFLERIDNNNIRIVSVSSLPYDFDSTLVARLALLAGLPPPRVNVLVSSFDVIFRLGYSNVRVLGAEMDRIKSLEVDQLTNETYLSMEYFYNSSGEKLVFKNKISTRKSLPVHIRLSREASTFKWFALLAGVARHKGVSLFNASSYSLIDSLDRGDLD